MEHHLFGGEGAGVGVGGGAVPARYSWTQLLRIALVLESNPRPQREAELSE